MTDYSSITPYDFFMVCALLGFCVAAGAFAGVRFSRWFLDGVKELPSDFRWLIDKIKSRKGNKE